MTSRRTTLPPPQPLARPLTPETVRAFTAVTTTSVSPRLQFQVEREAGVAAARVVVHDGDFVRIGSHPSNDLILADPMVSRFHCRLTKEHDQWRLGDNGSLNGTRVGGIVVRDADVPRGGCTIELGESLVRVRELAAMQTEPMHPAAALGSMHGESPAMRKLFALIERVAASEATVLIEGESGTGKELVATEIVRLGERADKPFVIVDCGAISPNLFESTLFGHTRGSFTGADRDRVGAFEAASGGTVFLDEIGEMPLDMQPKLLRVLQGREVCRVGENKSRPVDVRVIAATNRRLEREVNHGTFREDLFFRLSVITVRVPPLRERLEDLATLVRALLESIGAPAQARQLFEGDALEQMAAHDWPGNVRELRNYVERAVVLDSVPPAGTEEAMERMDSSPPEEDRVVANVDLGIPLRLAKETLVATFEKKYIKALLAWSDGNVSRAARKAEMDRINLHRLLQRYGLRTSRSMKD